MPIHEYRCNRCAQRFERLTFDSATPSCPGCRSGDVARQLSSFAVGGGGARTAGAASPCGSCGDRRGPGACSLGEA